MLELLRRRGEHCGEDFDSMGLLQTLCLVKTDVVDGNKAGSTAGKKDQSKTNTDNPRPANTGPISTGGTTPASLTDQMMGTEMKGEREEGWVFPGGLIQVFRVFFAADTDPEQVAIRCRERLIKQFDILH